MKSIKSLVFVLLLSLLFVAQQALAQTPSPTILETTLLKAEYGDQIMVKGLSAKDTVVLIYINGSYYSLANISNNDPDLNNFSYLSPVIKKSPAEKYTVTAISRGLNDFSLSSPTESKVSAVIEQSYFKEADQPKETILKPNTKTSEPEVKVSAPTLIAPKGNVDTPRPIISGFSKNKTTVRIYIDNVPESEILVKDNPSGTSNFEYTPSKDISRGLHFIHAIAIDSKGKESPNSNLLYFFVSQPQFISTSTVAEFDPMQPQINIERIREGSTETTSSSSVSNHTKRIVGPALNISLLVLFVIGVLIWIITTNLELKKEQENKKKEEPVTKK